MPGRKPILPLWDSSLTPPPADALAERGVGAGALHLRRQPRGRDREAAVRPLLHQEHVDCARPLHHPRDGQDRDPASGGAMRRGRGRADRQRDDGRRRGLLPRQRLRPRRAARRVGAHGEPRRAPTPSGSSTCSTSRRARRRSSSSAGSRSVTRPGPAIAARGHEIASHGYGHGSSTTRRRGVPRRRPPREGAARAPPACRCAATARRAIRSRRDRCGRSTC